MGKRKKYERRIISVATRKLLHAPCIFCGYSGELYWQEETHDIKCPWRNVGGELIRQKELKKSLLQDMATAYMEKQNAE